MPFFKKHQFKHTRKPMGEQSGYLHESQEPADRENTGSEAAYFKSLVDSHAKVTVVLTSGEQLRGHIRYYDQHCFSLGLSAKGPRLFLRKENVSHISES
jgi:sRNA-binding regulator protein Hfq